MQRFYSSKNIFIKFIFSYIPAILVISFLQTIFIFTVLHDLGKNSVNVIRNVIESDVYATERKLEQVQNIAFGVLQNKSVEPFLKAESNKELLLEELNYVKDILSSYSIDNPLIPNIVLQNNVSDLLISESTVYSKRINFYKSFFESGEELCKEYLANSETASEFSGKGTGLMREGQGTAIPFFLKMHIRGKAIGSVAVYVNREMLLSSMLDLIEKSGGAVKIFSRQDELLVESGTALLAFDEFEDFTGTYEKKRIDGEDYCVFAVSGQDFGWRYVLMLPRKYVLGDTLFYRYTSFIFNFVSILGGLAISFFIARRKSHSYLELLGILGIESDGLKFITDEFKSLHPHISKMQQEKQDMAYGDNQHALSMLINGGFEKTEEIEKELAKSKIVLRGNKYGVMVLHHENKRFSDSFGDNFRSFMQQELSLVMPGAHIYFVDRNTIVLIFAFDYDEEQFYSFARLSIAKLEVEIFFKYHIPVVFGVSAVSDSLKDIKTAYMQANEAVTYNKLNDGNNQWFYAQLPDDTDKWYYPIELENALFESVLEANFSLARDILQKVKDENFVNRRLSLGNINELMSELKASIKKISALQSEEIEFKHTDMNVNHFFEYAVNFFYVLCSDAENKSHTRGDKICDEILEHINKNYSDASLTLVFYAELYNINSSYLSRLFKKNVGTGLANYIESVRVNKAAELLFDSSLTIADIAESAGFGSVSTFRRVFKKLKGVNPSDYIRK